MPQEPFTPAGVQQKLSDLYVLTDAELESEAADIRSDFRAWINSNFTLDTQQQSYLSAIDQDWIDHASDNTSFAIKKRLPITLVKEGTGDVASKVIRQDSNLWNPYDPNGSPSPGGSLTFTITYS